EIRLDAAVENGRLGTGELDRQVVDHVRRDGGEQMLDGVNRGLSVADRGAAFHRLYFREPCRHFGRTREVGPAKDDALPRGRRQERRFRRGAGVQTRATQRRATRGGTPSGRWGQRGSQAGGAESRLLI